jgi:hypothetical protein
MAEEITRQELNTRSACKWAEAGKIEAWVHKYLTTGRWANPAFSVGLKRQKRWWVGPLEVKLTDLSPAVGTDPGMEFVVEDEDTWFDRTSRMAESFSDPLSLPPLIVEYRNGELSIRDGNTRYTAMQHLGWSTCWVIIWYNSMSDYQQHAESLF